jgi:predicted membrane protein
VFHYYFDLKFKVMNEEKLEGKLKNRWENYERKKDHGRVWMGLFLFSIGILLILKTSKTIIFPDWFFDWPTLLIGMGIFSGLRHRFRGGVWIILILVGGLSMAERIDPSLNLDKYIWPIAITAVGLVLLVKPRKPRKKWQEFAEQYLPESETQLKGTPYVNDAPYTDRRDFLDVTAVFGGVKKNVLSKNFQGGDITSIMGGSEIDLTQADFTGRITIDTTNIFGGTKLIVPPTWDVQSEITAIFGGVDDKRQLNGIPMDHNKVLILDGTCMFGGIEIRSF